MTIFKIFPLFLLFLNVQQILTENFTESHQVSRRQAVFNFNSIYQQQFSRNSKFFCDLSVGARSATVPTSVHKLKPGDIDVVAAIGDSATAAFGAVATNMLDYFKGIEYRGLSWSIGGQLDWNRYFTLPNVLKLYNPKLYGYSLNEYNPGYNLALTGALSSDSMRQASILVNKMYQDPKVDVQNHWKLITIFIGNNDFCKRICTETDEMSFLRSAANDLINTLSYLKNKLPRTLVNVVLPFNVDGITKLKNGPSTCPIYQELLCPCYIDPRFWLQKEQFLRILNMWRLLMEYIVKFPEFHDSDTFEVNIHRFTEQATVPTHTNRNTDMSYFSIDCLHFTPKGHALMANALWNSMLTSESQRAKKLSREFSEVKCPTKNNPYLATVKNS